MTASMRVCAGLESLVGTCHVIQGAEAGALGRDGHDHQVGCGQKVKGEKTQTGQGVEHDPVLAEGIEGSAQVAQALCGWLIQQCELEIDGGQVVVAGQ